jgi:mono/diheme cytochrome c family protein
MDLLRGSDAPAARGCPALPVLQPVDRSHTVFGRGSRVTGRVIMRSLILFVVSGVLVTAQAFAGDATQVEKGKSLFTTQKCTLCHSVAGKGNPKGSLEEIGDKLKADEIRQWLTSPKEMAEKAKATRKPPMQSYAKLAKPDLDALVAYLESLKKKK